MRPLLRLSARVVLCLLVAPTAGAAAADSVADSAQSCAGTGLNLTYEASIAGVNAGQAKLQVTRAGRAYRVAGTARSKGLWETMQQWRAEYSVDGEIASMASAGPEHPDAAVPKLPDVGHFYSLQTTPKKRREIHIENGVLKETKNHKVRDPRPAQTGYDLLSALFFLPVCHDRARIHTGRDGYEFSRLAKSDDSEGCSYAVEDEEGTGYRLELTYQQLEGFNVPQTISLRGALPGRMLLVDFAPLMVPAGCVPEARLE